jgi:hypothetical protein
MRVALLPQPPSPPCTATAGARSAITAGTHGQAASSHRIANHGHPQEHQGLGVLPRPSTIAGVTSSGLNGELLAILLRLLCFDSCEGPRVQIEEKLGG